MKTYLLIGAALISAAGFSAAASAETFSGPFVGVQAGWNHDKIGGIGTPVGDVRIDRTNDSLIGGLVAGYDYKLSPKIVVGGEADLNFGSNDRSLRNVTGGSVAIDPKRSIDLSARAGYLVTPDTLLYGRAGYTNVRAATTIANGTLIRSGTANLDGWTLGAGVERALSQKISTRLEYRYSDLSEGHGKYDRQQVLFGVAYHF
jgi:outer membrane immunogenic protein